MDTISVQTNLFQGDIIIDNIAYCQKNGDGETASYYAVLENGVTLPITAEQYELIKGE